MVDQSDAGAVIANDGSGVRLSRIGPPSQFGCPTHLEVWAGPFAGSITDDTFGRYDWFSNQVRDLYVSLEGRATLESYRGSDITLKGNGKGQITVSVYIVAQQIPSIYLAFEFVIDQTYLPRIRRDFAREFLVAASRQE